MALINNLFGLMRRQLLSDLRVGVRLFSDIKTQEQDDAKNTNEAPAIDPTIDRTKSIPVETSMRYLKSNAYRQTYGDTAVWVKYRRNHKGQFAPRITRKTCIRKGLITTGNPCPICRDEYLVIDAHNVELLKQFICVHTGQVLNAYQTGLCQKKHKQLLVAIEQAWDQGKMTYEVPFREYDYSQYTSQFKK